MQLYAMLVNGWTVKINGASYRTMFNSSNTGWCVPQFSSNLIRQCMFLAHAVLWTVSFHISKLHHYIWKRIALKRKIILKWSWSAEEKRVWKKKLFVKLLWNLYNCVKFNVICLALNLVEATHLLRVSLLGCFALGCLEQDMIYNKIMRVTGNAYELLFKGRFVNPINWFWCVQSSKRFDFSSSHEHVKDNEAGRMHYM